MFVNHFNPSLIFSYKVVPAAHVGRPVDPKVEVVLGHRPFPAPLRTGEDEHPVEDVVRPEPPGGYKTYLRAARANLRLYLEPLFH